MARRRSTQSRRSAPVGTLDRAAVGVVALGMPFPDADRPVDVLDADFAAILETNVDPVADAFVDDRGDADPAGLGERLQPRGDVDAIAVDVVAFDDDIAEIDADAQHDVRLARALIRHVAPERCTESAQFTASTTLPNSTMVPSPISFTMRPLWAATAGSKMVSRCRFRAPACPPRRLPSGGNSRPHRPRGSPPVSVDASSAMKNHTGNVRNPGCGAMLTVLRPNLSLNDGELGLGLGHHVRNGLKRGPPQEAER